MKRKILIYFTAAICVMLAGCSGRIAKQDSRTDVEFTVVPRDKIPEELSRFIEEKKTEEFSMSYGTGGYLYIVKGYGAQPTGGYSIRVDSLKESSSEIYFHTTLKGPEASEPVNKRQTYPYIVVKIEFSDKKIVFE